MKQSWLTLFRYIYSLTIGATSALVIFYSHDITIANVVMLVGSIVVAGMVLAVIELVIWEAMSE
jgi:hypothetical protein